MSVTPPSRPASADGTSSADAATLPPGLERTDPDYRRVLGATLAAGLAAFNTLYCTQAMLPRLTTAFEITPTISALTVSATTGALALCVVPASILSERFGRGRIMTISLIASILIGLLLPFSPTATWLIIGRGLQGAMIAGVPAVAMALLSEELAPAALAKAIGVYIAGTSLGGLSGRLIPAGVLELSTWRWALGANLLFAGICAIIAIIVLPPQRRFQPKRLRFRGELQAMAGHWKNPRLAGLFLIAGLAMGVFVSLYNYVGFVLINDFGLSEALVGVVFLLYLAGTWSSARAGVWSSKYGSGITLVCGAGTSLIALLVCLAPQLGVLLAAILVFTAAFFVVHSTASAWVGHTAVENRAEASSTYVACYYLGSSVFGWLSGLLFDATSWTGLILGLAAVSTLTLGIGGVLFVASRRSEPSALP
ncbi:MULTISPECIES: MFS transporter [Corynebacterium]|uniref:MFS transporter n=1 Tax=Corynebacterium TaxID=1716 RepID=UPI00124CDF36|nr:MULTISPECIES: MFS transporter [Corynebacterium]